MNNLKTLMLVALVCFTANMANAQTPIFSEDFESGALPTGWTKTQNSPSVGWEFGATAALSSGYFSIPAHTNFTVSNDDKHDVQAATANLANRDLLISPAINLTGYTGAAMTFEAFFTKQYGSLGTVEVTTNGGSTWTVVKNLDGDVAWQTLRIDLTAYAGLSIQLGFRHNDQGAFASGFAIDDVSVFEPEPNDVAVVSINMDEYVGIGVYNVGGTYQNLGSSTLTSYKLLVSTNGGSTWKSEIVTGVSVAPGNVALFNSSFGVDLSLPNETEVMVKIEDPNFGTDADPTNNSFSKTVVPLTSIPDKNILLEEFSGAWCGWCTDGAYQLELLLAAQSNVIGVTIHCCGSANYPDDMTVAVANALTSEFNNGFPSGMVDRVKFADQENVDLNRGLWATKTAVRSGDKVPATIATTVTYNGTSRLLTVDVTSTFYANLTGDYRMSVFLVEDDVTGSGSGYNQVNYIYNRAGYSGHPYYSQPATIVGFQHQQVVRDILGGTWGDGGNIPATTVAGTPYADQFTKTLPATWNAANMRIVAVVQKYTSSATDRPILNAVEADFGTTQSVSASPVSTVFDVLVADITHNTCAGGNTGAVTVSGVGGSGLTFSWSNGGTGSTVTGLAAGTYTVTMTDGGSNTTTSTVTIYDGAAGELIATITDESATGAADGSITVTGINAPGPFTYAWSNGGVGATVPGLSLGSYTVTVTDGNGCQFTRILDVNAVSGVNGITGLTNFGVYPNPANSEINLDITLAESNTMSVEIVNALGAVVYQQDLGNTNAVKHNINLQNLSEGIYFVKLKVAGGISVERLLIAR